MRVVFFTLRRGTPTRCITQYFGQTRTGNGAPTVRIIKPEYKSLEIATAYCHNVKNFEITFLTGENSYKKVSY